MGDPAAARIETLQRRLQENPDSKIFLQLAEEYRRTGELEAALEVCRRGLEKNPCYHSARASLGRLYMELGRHAEAVQEFEKVLSVAPDNLLARKMLESLRTRPAGKESGGNGNGPREGVTRREPSSPTGPAVKRRSGRGIETETLAEIYLQQGHRGEAIRIYERILRAQPGNRRAREKLAELRRGASGPPGAPGEGSAAPRGRSGSSDPVRRKIAVLRGWLEQIRRE